MIKLSTKELIELQKDDWEIKYRNELISKPHFSFDTSDEFTTKEVVSDGTTPVYERAPNEKGQYVKTSSVIGHKFSVTIPFNEGVCFKNFRTSIPKELIDRVIFKCTGSYVETVYYEVYHMYMVNGNYENVDNGFIPFYLPKDGFPAIGITLEFHLKQAIDSSTLTYDCYESNVDIYNYESKTAMIEKETHSSQYLESSEYGLNFWHATNMFAIEFEDQVGVGDIITLTLEVFPKGDGMFGISRYGPKKFYEYDIEVAEVFESKALFKLPCHINGIKMKIKLNRPFKKAWVFSFQALRICSRMAGLLFTQ